MLTNKQLFDQHLMNKQKFLKMVSLPNIELEAEEADRFIDYIVDESVLKSNARIVRMSKETKNIRALGLGSATFLHPGATFSVSDYKKELSENRIQLTSKKVRGCAVIYDDDLEDNVEGDAFADHVMRMVTAKIANELDEAFWIGDTHGLGGFANTDVRSLWDGWRYIITHSGSGEAYENHVSGAARILDAATDFDLSAVSQAIAAQNTSAPYNWEFKYARMLKTMPSKYRKVGLANLRFFHSDQVSQDYVDALAERSTILGDNAILGKAPLQFGKVSLADCPLMSITLDENGVHGAGSYTDCVLTHRSNFIVGIQRNVRIEGQREAADEATYFFYSMRADVTMENVNAVVMTTNLTCA